MPDDIKRKAAGTLAGGLAGHTPVKTSGAGRLYEVDGLAFLQVAGSPYEMGRQHGEMLRAEIHDGVVPRYGDFVEYDHVLRNLPAAEKDAFRAEVDGIFERLHAHVSEPLREELRGIADGAELPYELVFRANYFSELSQVLGKRRFDIEAGPGVPPDGCTGLVALAGATETGELIAGKNHDYPGTGLWDRFPVVIHYQPEDAQQYVKATSAGLLKCNFSMNEAGITLGGHMLFSAEAEPDGRAFVTIENEIMREATDLDAAIERVEREPRAGCFAFVLTSWKEDRAVCLETNSKHVGRRDPEDGVLAMSNVTWADEEVMGADLARLAGAGRNAHSRFQRMREMLHEQRGHIDAEAAAAMLGDHRDCSSDCARPVGHVIASQTTVTSALAVPAEAKYYAAVGRAPVSNNPYLGFDFSEAFSATSNTREVRLIDPLAGNREVGADTLQAAHAYNEAIRLWDAGEDAEGALGKLAEAREVAGDEPVFARLAGRLLLRQGKTEAAREAFEQALPLTRSENERRETELLLGNVADLAGDREAAAAHYRRVIEDPDAEAPAVKRVNPLLVKLARGYLETPFDEAARASLPVNFTFQAGFE
jgi:isopenicillin-N N-acyltransferase-like protein